MLVDLSILNKRLEQLLEEHLGLRLCIRKCLHHKDIFANSLKIPFLLHSDKYQECFFFSTENACRSEFTSCFQASLIPDRKLSMKHDYFPITGFSLEWVFILSFIF